MKRCKKRVAFIITLIVIAFGTTENPVKDTVLGGLNAVRGFATLPADDVQTAIVTVSSASFATLHTTAVELVPAPGDGRVNQVIAVTAYRNFASESWNRQSAQRPSIGFQGINTLGAAITASLSNALFTGGEVWTQTSPSYITVYPADHIASSSAVILRRVGSATPTIDGDTSFKFFVYYRIVNLP